MLLVASVHKEKRFELNGRDRDLEGIAKLKSKRSVVPAITHVDYSARIQTVDADRHGRYYKLLKAFERRTGSPVIINTSFNVRGEPIVHTPQQAYRCFVSTNIDALVLERFVLLKEDQPDDKSADREKYLAEFKLD
jgi:carbamoyltransferase